VNQEDALGAVVPKPCVERSRYSNCALEHGVGPRDPREPIWIRHPNVLSRLDDITEELPWLTLGGESLEGKGEIGHEIGREDRAAAGRRQGSERPQVGQRQNLARRCEERVGIGQHVQRRELELRQDATRKNDVEWAGEHRSYLVACLRWMLHELF